MLATSCIYSILQDVNILSRTSKNEDVSKICTALMSSYKDFMSENLRVSVCGCYDVGKSSFINAILRQNIVISSILPSTGVITKIGWGETTQCEVYYESGEVKNISLEELERFTVKDNSNQNRNLLGIREVCIQIPSSLLRKGVVLIDTPGLDDSSEMDEITYRQLDKSDFIIFILNALELQNKSDLVMRYYNRLGKNVIFVVNKMDYCRTKRDYQDVTGLANLYYKDYYNTITYTSDICFISAQGDNASLQYLIERLQDTFFSKKDRIMRVSRLSIIKDELNRLCDSLRLEQMSLEQVYKNTLDHKLKYHIEDLRSDMSSVRNIIEKIYKLNNDVIC